MLKKLPSNTNVNGIVGKPAEPTAEPGGRPAAAVCVAGTPVAGGGVVVLAEVEDEDDDEVEDEDEDDEPEPEPPEADATAAAWATAGAAAGVVVPVEDSLIERKSMCASCEVWLSW